MRNRHTTALLIVMLLLLAARVGATTRIVNVGPNLQLIFVDQQSNTSTTTINVGDTVQWVWQGNHHSTTSGSCASGTCVHNFTGVTWDSGVHDAGNIFSFTFMQAGTFTYFCSIHGTTFQMRGTVKVIAPPDFTLQISNPSLSAFPNQGVNFQGTLTSVNGYASSVTVSCGGTHPANCGQATVTPAPGGTAFSIAASDPTDATFSFPLNAVGTDANKTSHSQTVTLAVSDFDLAGVTGTTVIAPPTGTSTRILFTVKSLNGFSGTVALACAGAPAGASCNFSPANVAVSGSDVQVPLTVTTAGAATADSLVSITANSSGGTQKSANFTLSVWDIGLTTPSPSTLATDPTATSPSATFSVTAAGSFAGPVTLSCLGLPPGAGCNFSPSTPFPTAARPVPVSVQVVTAGVLAGTLNLQIAADFPGLSEKTQNLTVQVQDYTLAFANPIVAIFPGKMAVFNGTLTAANGYGALVALSCIAPPSACSFSPSANVTPTGAGAGFTTSISTAAGIVPQDYPFQVQGIGADAGTTTHAQNVTMRVIDFSLGPISGLVAGTPPSLSVVQGNPSSPVSFSLATQGQFAGTITLSCAGLPSGASCQFSPSAVLAPRPGQPIQVSAVVSAGSATVGTSSVTITATATGTATAKTEPAFNLDVTAGSGTTNLNLSLALTQPNPGSPAAVGGKVIFTSTVSNLAAGSVQATLVTIFSQPVSLVNAPNTGGISCNPSAGTVTDTVTCQFTSTNGTATPVALTVAAPFARSLTVSAFVSSGAMDTDSSDNSASNVVEIRLRPLSRNGLPIGIP